MIMKANKQIGFIYKNNESIDKILKDGDVVFEKGFLREKTSTTLPINFGGIGKNLKDYKVYGNTYQNSTSGKNFTYIEPRTSNGITSFYDKETGKISFSGTPTQQWIGIENKHAVSIPAGTYTLSLKESKSFRIIVRYYTDDTNYEEISISANSKSSTKTFSNNIITTQIWIQLVVGTTYNEEFYMQLEQGSTATEFEPYTNGASPNPDYPQEIISCGNRTKNLCGELEQGGYDVNTGEKNTNTTLYRNKEPIKVLPNTNYIFSINGVGQAVNVLEYKADGTYIGRIGSGAVSSNSYFTTSSETGYINIFRGASAGIEKWQIEQNDTISSYEPYGYKIPVNVRSDNLFDGEYETGGYDISTGEKVINTSQYRNINFIEVKPNTTYVFSINGTTIIETPRYFYYDKNKNKITSEVTNGIFTTPNNCYFLNWHSSGLKTNYPDGLIKPMIIEDSTAPSKYIPYYNETTNIYLDEPLRKIDRYSDYIDFINGKVVRNIEEYTLIGDEQIKMIREGMNCVKIDGKNIRTETNTMPPIFCNMLLANSRNLIYQGNVGIGYGAINNEYYNDIVMRVPNITTLTDFTTWLQSNNATVDYVLETPTEEDIELPNIPTIDENNTLNIETEITPSQVYIKYKSNT